jgi:GTP-binding protein HflX
MQKEYETAEKAKKAFLVSIINDDRVNNEAMCRELEGLCTTLGLDIIGHERVKVREKSSKYGMGSGKAEELSQKAADLEADCLVFDWNLDGKTFGPSQQRNWEELTGIAVLDRPELIIRIFAERAATREAELQVRLAELSYFLPRLSHKYIDLSRQRGGRYGTKGSGETKLETDRRQIEKKIHLLKKEIEQIRKQRQVQRRKRQGLPVYAIIGYTNAGKSSLLNALTGADVPAENKLFATLDTVTRRFRTAPESEIHQASSPILLSDTVGFIRQLPHSLITAFRSTLEETAKADALIHVLDASDMDIDNCYQTTFSVLRELGAHNIPMITVLNKTDIINDETLAELQNRYLGSIAISVKTGKGLDALKTAIVNKRF